MSAAYLRPVRPTAVRTLLHDLRSRVDGWTIYALNAQPWVRHTPTR
jgi:hypothetical protein